MPFSSAMLLPPSVHWRQSRQRDFVAIGAPLYPRERYVVYTARLFDHPETARAAFAATRTILKNISAKDPMMD